MRSDFSLNLVRILPVKGKIGCKDKTSYPLTMVPINSTRFKRVPLWYSINIIVTLGQQSIMSGRGRNPPLCFTLFNILIAMQGHQNRCIAQISLSVCVI